MTAKCLGRHEILRDRIARQPVLGEGSTPDVPPAAFGRFKLLHHIRDGSLGPVFRAEDPYTEQPVTIQQLRVNASPALVGRITEGLGALVGSLPDHPSVPRVLEADADDTHPYVVTTSFDGDTLDEALREYGPAEIEDALPRLRVLAKALDKAANVGLWHGLLQPRDVVIAANATGLTGLGIAPVLERAGARMAPQQAYTAPEVLEGHPSSPAGDQFSLAAIAYEWLFGRRIPSVTSSQLDVPVVPGIDNDILTHAFQSALAANPADRFENCWAFVDAIARSTSATAVTASTVGTVGTPGLSETSELSTDDLYFDSEPATGAASAVKRSRSTRPSPAQLDESLVRDEPVGVPDEPVIVGNDPVIVPDDPEIVPDEPVLVHDEPALVHDDDPVLVPAQPKVLAFDEPPHTTSPPIPWRGSLTAVDEKPSEHGRGRFTWTALAAVLVVGFAGGLAAGYVIGNRGQQALAIDGTDSGAAGAAPGGREFTDAPVPASAPAPAGSTPTDERASATAAAPPAARAGNARLLVRSTPAGAAVTVDGAPSGTTPLTLRDLETGTRKVVVSRPGYATAERRITLTKDRPSRSLEVRLSPLKGEAARQARRLPVPPASTTGSLLVDSRPAGAAVTIDGRAAGTTPLTVPTIAAGSHDVRIDLGGYTPVTTTVEVKAGERARFAATLVRGQQE